MNSQQSLNVSACWGQYSDLYKVLKSSEVELLEKAILARRLGRFAEAREIHDNRLPDARLIPVLALEKANLASRLGLPGQEFKILEEALDSSSTWPQPNSPGETALLQISMIEAKLQWTGGLRTALKDVRTLRDHWSCPDWSTWTDVEIAIAIKYFGIMRSCRLLSNWVDLDTDAMFLAGKDSHPWSGLQCVLNVAERRGNQFACTELINLYTALINDKDLKMAVFSSFISNFEKNDNADTNWQVSLVLVYARIWFAEMLQELSEEDHSSDQLSKAHCALSALPWILERDTPNLLLKKLLMPSHEELLFNGKNLDFLALAIQLSDFATVVNACEDRLLETQLLARAMTTLNQVKHTQRYRNWYELNEALYTRYGKLHDNGLARAVLRAGSVSRLGNSVGPQNDPRQCREYLHELTRFQNQYPDFDVPTSLRDFYRGAAVSLKRLGNSEDARLFEAKTASALHSCPIDPSQFFRIYRGRPFNEWAPYLLDIMLPWIRADFVAAKLSVDQVALMLNITISATNPEVTPDSTLVLGALERPGEAFVGNLFGYPTPLRCEIWASRFKLFEEWLWDAPSNIERYIRHTILGDLQQARCASVDSYVWQVTNRSRSLLDRGITKITPEDLAAVYDEDLELEVRAMKISESKRLVNLRNRLDRRAMGTDDESGYTIGSTLASERIQLSTSAKAFRDGLIGDGDLAETQTWLQELYPRLNSNNATTKLATLQQLALIQFQRYVLFGTLAADASLDTYKRYDDVYTEQRVARSILQGAESVMARSATVTPLNLADLCDFAMGVCVEALGAGQRRNAYHRHIHQDLHYTPAAAPPPSRSKPILFTELVNWAQRKKARSLSEAFGAELIIPHNFLLNASGQIYARTLLAREAALQTKINNSKEVLPEVSRDLDQLRQRMRNCPALEKIMELRDGRALSEAQIQSFAALLGDNVVIVDFVLLPTAFTAILGEIVPMIYKKGRLVSADFVTPQLRHATIKTWIETFLDQQKPLSDARPALGMLFPLVEKAVKFSSPGDTIVLCPTDILCNIPLHAIELPDDGTPFLQRNPIVYTQSLSVLRISHYAATTALNIKTHIKPLAVQALSEHDSKLPGAAKMGFAARCGAHLLQGNALTKRSFLTQCAESDLINFYGHIYSDSNRPLDQYLAIREAEEEKVTVRDLFDFHLRSGSHVNLIGCRSGFSDVGNNDDRLGLSTALFYAGAASMVTTLWSIDMADGDAFQEGFFDEILAQSAKSKVAGLQQDVNGEAESESPRAFIDFAKALQAAVLRMSMDSNARRRPPYHWAAFTLMGSWNTFPLLKVDNLDTKSPSEPWKDTK